MLRKTAANITPDYPGLQQFIADMWETMYDADGVGLAAPQVGKASACLARGRCFPWAEEEPELADFKKTFINAEMANFGDEWRFSEGVSELARDPRGCDASVRY